MVGTGGALLDYGGSSSRDGRVGLLRRRPKPDCSPPLKRNFGLTFMTDISHSLLLSLCAWLVREPGGRFGPPLGPRCAPESSALSSHCRRHCCGVGVGSSALSLFGHGSSSTPSPVFVSSSYVFLMCLCSHVICLLCLGTGSLLL